LGSTHYFLFKNTFQTIFKVSAETMPNLKWN